MEQTTTKSLLRDKKESYYCMLSLLFKLGILTDFIFHENELSGIQIGYKFYGDLAPEGWFK